MSPARTTRSKAGRRATQADIRREIASWSTKELVDFALDYATNHEDAWAWVERRLAAKSNPEALLATLRRQIDEALRMSSVDWKHASDYAAKLGVLLEDIRDAGKAQPQVALEAAQYFLDELPDVFDSVDSECELEMLCEDLGEAIVKLSARAHADPLATAATLLDAYLADGYDQMGSYPKTATTLATTPTLKKQIHALLEERAAHASNYKAKELREAATAPSRRERRRG